MRRRLFLSQKSPRAAFAGQGGAAFAAPAENKTTAQKAPRSLQRAGRPFFCVGGHRLSIYSEAFVAAIAPSATAVETCRTAFVRQSPATNTPGVRVLQLSSAMM